MRQTAAQKPGFTLIELLVVIAIISILASMLMPVFARARAKGRQTACLSNVKQLCLAIKMYTQDYDEILPFGRSGDEFWHDAIYAYTHNKQIYRCPDRPDRYIGYGYNWLIGWGLSEGSFFDSARKIVVGDVPPECLGATHNSGGTEWWINDPGNDICGAWGGDVAVGTEDPSTNCFTDIRRPQRHNDGIIYGYADGHAKHGKESALDLAEFWNPQVSGD